MTLPFRVNVTYVTLFISCYFMFLFGRDFKSEPIELLSTVTACLVPYYTSNEELLSPNKCK